MKIKYIFQIIILILISEISLSQDNSTYKVTVGDKTIIIPTPAPGFVEIGELKRNLLENQVPKNNKLLACYLPSEISDKFGYEPVVIRKRIMVEVLRANENKDFSDAEYNEVKTIIKDSFSPPLERATDDANIHYAKLKDQYGNLHMKKPVILYTVEDTKNSYSFLTLMNINTDAGIVNVLTGTIILRIKNRVIYIYASSILENDTSLNWVSNTINTLGKSITDLNK